LNKKGRFFHIGVSNRHREKIARNCYAYLEKVTKLDTQTEIPLKAVELKWRGYTFPSVGIPPRTVRDFDAFFILHDSPETVCLQCFSDASEYNLPIRSKGLYELQYTVLADNFPPARRTFKLNLDSTLDSTRFE
jgi:hypothetical protein